MNGVTSWLKTVLLTLYRRSICRKWTNAVNQTKKEIAQRYDFRGSDASIELEEKCIKLAAEDEYS